METALALSMSSDADALAPETERSAMQETECSAMEEFDDEPEEAEAPPGSKNSSPGDRGPLQNKRCFPPDTLFKTVDGLIKAASLTLGDKVLDRNQQLVEVVSVVTHPHQREEFVDLISEGYCKLTVTGSHRIPIPTARGDEEKLACNLKQHDWLYSGEKAVKLIEVKHYVQEMSVVELMFENDAAVEAYPLPLEGLVTLGQAVGEPQQLVQCKIEDLEGALNEVLDDGEACTSTGSTGSGAASPTQEISESSDMLSAVSDPKSRRSGRLRTRTAKLKYNLQRLPSPDSMNF